MAPSVSPETLAGQARRLYTEELVKGLVPLVQAALDHARNLLDKPSEHVVFQRRRELVVSTQVCSPVSASATRRMPTSGRSRSSGSQQWIPMQSCRLASTRSASS